MAHDVEYATTSDAFRYLRCPACAALFIDPVPRTRLAEIYPPTYYTAAGPATSPVARVKEHLDARRVRRLLAGIPGETLAVLDVGGGHGGQLDLVRRVDPRVHRTQLVDLAPGDADALYARGHGVFAGRIEDFTTPERFDLILLLNLVEHVEDPVGVLAHVRTLLAPGGVVLVSTPNTDSLDARLFRHRSWAGYHCPRHWVLFTEASFRRAAHAAGLAVESCTYTQGAPFWAASAVAWLAARGVGRITTTTPAVAHPLFMPLAALFAAVDFARRPFARTSQMELRLARDPAFD
ncbi:MAG: class I SAM-dependent methyltransferase [bacterium]|nr:class I SAM-dependent methyltransferase [bacterium]